MILILVFFTFVSAFAQNKRIEKIANGYFLNEEYHDALPFFLKLDSLTPDVPDYQFKIGVCYYNTHFKPKALAYFEKAQKIGVDHPELDLYLARVYHLNHRFDEAIKYYTNFKNKQFDNLIAYNAVSNASDDEETKRQQKDMRKYIDKYIEMCEVGMKLVEDSLELEILNMGPEINSIYADYVPVVNAVENTLIFTSRRDNSTGGKKDPQDFMYFEDLYISHKDSSGLWGPAENMGNVVNSDAHDAAVALSPDGQKLFIYRSSNNKNASGDLYESDLNGDKWSKPRLMDDKINSPYWEPSVSISTDKKIIYFSSDRPGGFGGTDIYKVEMQQDGSYGDPVNLGPKVNTPYNEDAPYIHPDNVTLFFSSRGHQTMGGYDIFTTTLDENTKEWSYPENAGYPINTADDDIYFIWSEDGTKGYFSSWREDSYGEKDIYLIQRPTDRQNLMIVKGKVTDEKDDTPLGADLVVRDIDSNKIIGVYKSNDKTGKYRLALPVGGRYKIDVARENYSNTSGEVDLTKRTAYFMIKKDFKIKQTLLGAVLTFNNIFFDFDKATIRVEASDDLKNLYDFMKANPELKVKITGHTDSYGSDKYNMRLSKKRAKAVEKYLIGEGINRRRMKVEGMGESMPVATNTTDEGRQLNRRTEVTIIDTNFNPISLFKHFKIFYKNEYKKLDRSGSENLPTKSDSTLFNKFNKKTVPDNHLEYLGNEDYKIAYNQRPNIGEVLRPKAHFLHLNTEQLTQFSTERVNDVIKLMKKYPEMKLLIRGYGDHTGNLSANREVSRKRVETIYQMLVDGGVESNRLEKQHFVVPQDYFNMSYEEKELRKGRIEFVVIH